MSVNSLRFVRPARRVAGGLKVALLASLIAGCASRSGNVVKLPDYVAPVAGPTAKLVIRETDATSGTSSAVEIANGSDCKPQGVLARSVKGAIDEPRTLAAGHPVTLKAVFRFGTQFCQYAVDFPVVASATYVAGVSVGVNGCAITMAQVADDAYVRVPGLQRRLLDTKTGLCQAGKYSSPYATNNASANQTSTRLEDLDGLMSPDGR